jgi:DNA-directed RNA polymerase specialized sigma24 family protein
MSTAEREVLIAAAASLLQLCSDDQLRQLISQLAMPRPAATSTPAVATRVTKAPKVTKRSTGHKRGAPTVSVPVEIQQAILARVAAGESYQSLADQTGVARSSLRVYVEPGAQAWSKCVDRMRVLLDSPAPAGLRSGAGGSSEYANIVEEFEHDRI